MANNVKNVWVGLRFRPVSTLTIDKLGEVQSFSTDNKTYLHNGTTRSPLVTETHAATLTLKTIDADNNTISNLEVDNLKAGVLNTSTTLAGATDAQVPSALAVKTYVDNTFTPQTDVADLVTLTGVPANSTDLGTFTGTTIPDNQTIKQALQSLETGLEDHIADAVDAHDASAISFTPVGAVLATEVQGAIAEVDADLTAHIVDTVDAHDASAISVVAIPGVTGTEVQSVLEDLKDQIDASSGDVNGPASSTDNAIARFDGITGKLLQNSVVTVSDTGVVAGSSIDADTNTITNIENADIKAAANIARTKLASGTNLAVVHNDGLGVMTNSADLLVASNALILANTKHLEIQAVNDPTTSGANATLTAFNAGAVRLTNVALTSIANIPAGVNGQHLTIFNRTGVDVTISDSSAALGTAANRILTGTNATITFANNAALVLEYDATTTRWQIVGGTGSGTGSSASLDTILQLTASEQLTDWSTGDNATFLGGGTLAGTFVKQTSTPLHGTASYQYTQAAGSLDDYLASAVQPVDLRFRGQQVYLTFPFQYNGNTGDIQAIVYCATTSTIITTATDVVLGTNGATQSLVASCVIPLTCTGIRVGFHVKVLNSGKVLSFDDVQLSQSLYQAAQLNNVTNRQLYTPTFTGFGTVTNVEAYYDRDGEYLEIDCKFMTGTLTAVEARVSLPTGLISQTFTQGIRKVGDLVENAAAAAQFTVLMESATSYVTFGQQTAAQAGLTKQNANAPFANSTVLHFTARIPIQGWSAGNTAIVTPVQQISSDTIPFTFKATAIVDADPIGTFNTYTYAINTNTATISASAPTQTVASMNANGFQVFGRPFNAASTAASPARVDIKIGKGLKSTQLQAYASAAKVTGLSTDMYVVAGSSADERGTFTYYDETTGILTINAGLVSNTTITSKSVGVDSRGNTVAANGYFVFNASTAPSIAALPILSVSALYTGAPPTGTLNSSFNITTFGTRVKDSHSAYSGGSYTVPLSGVYSIAASINVAATFALNNDTDIAIFIDGVQTYQGTKRAGGAVTTQSVLVSVNAIPLQVGQVITIRSASQGTSPTFSASAPLNNFSITRTGSL